MKTSFTMEAPMVWVGGYEPKSGYSKLAISIGRMLGGLTVDGTRLKFDGTDFSLASAQMMLIEAGVDLFVMGASYSMDEKSSFIAMTDGSVWRFECEIKGGKLVTSARVASEDEISNECKQVVAMHAAIKELALRALDEEGLLDEGDSWMGHIVADGHAAICMRPFGHGVLIVSSKDGTDKGGWRFAIDAPRNADIDSAQTTMKFFPLEPEEIAQLRKRHMQVQLQTVEGSPFPQKIGVA